MSTSAPLGSGDRLVSVVVPLYDEEAMVELFHATLVEGLESLPYRFEFVFVDDGSSDRTRALIRELHAQDPRVKLIALSRNHGHQIALSAGLAFASGDAVITMDGDLQHPPALLRGMLEEWEKGAEVVQMVKEEQAERRALKSIGTRLFYRVFQWIGELEIAGQGSDFRLLGRKALRAIRAMPERERFLRGMVSWVGFRRVEILFRAPLRAHGVPKYTFAKMARLAVAGLLSFSTAPLTACVYLGLTLAFASTLYGLHAVVAKLSGWPMAPGYTDLMVMITGLAGVQLVFLGVIGVYIGKIFQEVKGRPLFVVDELVGIDSEEPSSRPS